MTSFLSARKRAEEFADAVDVVLGSTVSDAVARPPSAVESLLDVVVALRATPVPAARPDFAATLRERLLAEAATALAPGPAPVPAPTRLPARRSRSQGRVVVAATALVAVGGTAGVATAAQQALPGDALYPVKRAIESAELRLSTSDTGRGRDLLQQASHRLEEVDGLLPEAAGSSQAATRLTDTLGAFADQAVSGSTLMLDAYREDRDTANVVEVRGFAAQSMATLTSLAESAPRDLVGDLADAASAMQQVDEAARVLCPGCGDAAPLQVPPDFGPPAAGGGTEQLPDELSTSRDDDGTTEAGMSPTEGWSEDGGGPLPAAGTVGPTEQPGPSEGLPTDGVTPPGDPGPTGGPTGGPTQQETDGPTAEPTGGPTQGTTDEPTQDPTDVPSQEPTEEPTEEPTDHDGDPDGGSPDEDEGRDDEDDADEDDADDGETDGNDKAAGEDPDPADTPGGDSGSGSGATAGSGGDGLLGG
jgi:Domain of unknown function (DUF5667)